MTRKERQGLVLLSARLTKDDHANAEIRSAVDWISRQIAKDERQQKRRGRSVRP